MSDEFVPRERGLMLGYSLAATWASDAPDLRYVLDLVASGETTPLRVLERLDASDDPDALRAGFQDGVRAFIVEHRAAV